MSESKQVGIWLRVSTEDQVKGESLEVHEARARSYAESKGWQVAEVYRLGALSGKKVIDHPETRRMLHEIQTGHITGLIFSKLARLSRNNRELLTFAERFQAAGADLISLAESIDTSTPAGRMFYSMLAAMANWEREEIASRVAASVPVRAAMGRPLGGQAQYGYAWVDKRFVLVPEEAAVRKLMYELFIEHRRFRTVATILNERGYRTRSGKLWAGSSIERLVRDPTAMGKKRYHFTKYDKDGARVFRPESEWIQQDCEPIVSEELWHSVNAELTEKKLSGVRKPRTARTLFGGLARCSCGARMYVPSKTRKYVCTAKSCRRKIPIDTLDAIFASELSAFAFDPATLDEQWQQAEREQEQCAQLIDLIKGKLAEADSRIDALVALYQKGLLDDAGFAQRYEPHRTERDALAEELARLESHKGKVAARLTRQADALAETRNIHERWADMELPDKRRLIETVVDRVTIDEDSVTFDYLFNPTL